MIRTERFFMKSVATLAVFVLFASILYCINYLICEASIREIEIHHHGSLADSSTEMDWKNFDVNSITAKQIMDYFFWTNSSACRLANHFGGVMMTRAVMRRMFGPRNPFERMKVAPGGLDGQYAVCLDPPSVAPRPNNCLVYSFGINNEWSFDDAMAAYGCQVYSFDPSMKQADFDRSPKIHFYKLALEDFDQGNEDRKLSTIYEMLKPRHGDVVIDYLKIDIEHDEWFVIPQIIQSGMLSKVRQLVMEIHLDTHEKRLDSYRRFVATVKSLEDEGMVRFDSKYSPWCPAYIPALNLTSYICFQIAWYNSHFVHEPQ